MQLLLGLGQLGERHLALQFARQGACHMPDLLPIIVYRSRLWITRTDHYPVFARLDHSACQLHHQLAEYIAPVQTVHYGGRAGSLTEPALKHQAL